MLFKGRFFSFFNDSWILLKFVRRLSYDIGKLLTLQTVLVVLYKLGKVAVVNVRFIILHSVRTIFKRGKSDR